MPTKLLFTMVGFNGLAFLFLAGVVTIYLRPPLFGLMVSLFFGWLAGFINLGTTEPQFPVLLLLLLGFVLGYVVREGEWKYAIVMGAFIPLSQFLWIGATHQSDLLISDGVGSFVAFLPAFGGVYLGKLIRPAPGSGPSAGGIEG
ncbi:MAG TPA: hypothetical protein VMG34_14495, partial [Bacteroidota bacterium]|nr:hypothetical protein [Bacteroidota bacterium]